MPVVSASSFDSDELQLLPSPSPLAAVNRLPSPQPPRYRRSSVGRHPSTTADTAASPRNSRPRVTSSPRQHHFPATRTPSTPTSSSSSSSRRLQQQQRQRQQQESPSYWATRQLLSESHAPLQWERDVVSESQTARNAHVSADQDDEQFISLFVDEFSSPSSYPSFTNPPPTTNETARPTQSRSRNSTYASPSRPSATSSHQPPTPSRPFLPPLRSITQLSASSSDSRHSILIDDLVDDEGLTESTSSSTSFSENMPAVTRRNPSSLQDTQHHAAKRQRTIHSKPPELKDEIFLNSDDSLFGENPTRPPAVVANDVIAQEDLTTIDLTEATEVPEELRRPEVDNRVKMSAFQCAICMDDVTALTVTHCGHMFCKQCLHSSLHVESTKGKCPMCRAKIDMKARQSYTSKTKGYWPLELKLMTATRKGKRKVDNIS